MDITRSHHRRFLLALSPEEQAKDYEAMKSWNSGFDVHKVPSIPEASLPSRPNVHRTQSINDFLHENNIQNRAVAEVLSKVAQKMKDQTDSASAPAISAPAAPKSKIGLSERLIAIVTICLLIFVLIPL